MTQITEPLDRVAQSHIEGRVQRIRPITVDRFQAPQIEMDGPIRCRLCGVDYTREYHNETCPAQRSKS